MRSLRSFGCLFGLVLTMVVSGSVSAMAEEPASLDDLAFMVGHWAGESGSIEMEEFWTKPKGGVMLGLHRDVKPGEAAFFEFLRIEDRGGELVYIASPGGGETTEFLLVAIDEDSVVFENLGHDFPQRIVYRRDVDRLTARIEGEADGQLDATEWSWDLVR